MEPYKEAMAPPFEAWATVSVSDSSSDPEDERDFDFPTLADEVKRNEDAISAKFAKLMDTENTEAIPVLAPSPSMLGRSLEEECSNVMEALKKLIPVMEEDSNLYEELRALKTVEQRLS